MDKKTTARLIAFGVILFCAISRLDAVALWLYRALGVFKPVILGFVLAFLLNIPLRLVESLDKKNVIPRGVEIVFSVIIVLAIAAAAAGIILPQLAQATYSLVLKLPEWAEYIKEQAFKIYDDQQLRDWIAGLSIDWQTVANNFVNFLRNGAFSALSSAATVAGDVVGSVTSGIIAVIIALGALASKESLARQSKRTLRAFLKPDIAEKTIDTCSLVYRAYVGFFSAQLTEAVILGGLVAIGMLVFGFPRPFMVATLIAVGALVPMFGAFVAAVTSAMLIAAEFSLAQGLWFLLFFVLLQQIEGNVIYPRVMGNRIGLPSMWVIIAIAIGANTLGIVGMILFVPLASVVYTMLGAEVKRRESCKN